MKLRSIEFETEKAPGPVLTPFLSAGPAAGPAALAADVEQAFEQRGELIEVLQAADILGLDFGRRLGSFAGHALIMPGCRSGPCIGVTTALPAP